MNPISLNQEPNEVNPSVKAMVVWYRPERGYHTHYEVRKTARIKRG
jgi:hypothetical protein